MGRVLPISPTVERRLIRATQDHSHPRQRSRAHQQLLQQHQQQICGLVSSYATSADPDDLQQVASLALIEAVERYPLDECDIPLIPWLRPHLVKAIQAHIGLMSEAVSYPYQERAKLRRAQRAYEADYGTEPIPDDLRGIEMSRHRQEALEPSYAVDIDADDSWHPVVTETPETLLMARQREVFTTSLLECLSARERFVIEARYGLIDGREWGLPEIGGELSITPQRVSQIEHTALNKLRDAAEEALS